MAGRLIGDALWTSKKIASLPPDAKAEYAWLYPIAAYNGVFEIDIRALHVRAYAYSRPEITESDVERFIKAFEDAKLLFIWSAKGKRWGWWVGSNKPGRMPSKSLAQRYEERGTLPPYPPEGELRRFLGESDVASDSLASGKDEACQQQDAALAVASNRTELNRTELKQEAVHYEPDLDGSEAFETACGLYPKPEWDQPSQVAYMEAVGHIARKKKLDSRRAVGWLNSRIILYGERVGSYAVGFQKFLEKKIFDQPESSWGAAGEHRQDPKVDPPKRASLPLSERMARGEVSNVH